MDRVDRIMKSLRARKRRKTIKEINRGLFRRYCRKRKALRKKYKKIRDRHHTKNL